MNGREEYMVERYGEAVKIVTAAKILDRDRSTITRMIRDGRLESVCGGEMVCVHSIARYIEKPKVEDHKARHRRAGHKWAVV